MAASKPPTIGTPVWTKRTKRGFFHNVFVMYHGTSTKAAESIIENGFRPSTDDRKMLGVGFYFSKDYSKAIKYAGRNTPGDPGVVFKVLVYAGRTKKIDKQNHPMQKTWRSDFDTAWTPPNVGMVKCEQEENCVKCKEQIRILGVVKGYNLLSQNIQQKTRDVEIGDDLNDSEEDELKDMVEEDLESILTVTRNTK